MEHRDAASQPRQFCTDERQNHVLPLVSIVVPAFNAQATVEATLRSLKGSSLAEWEAIIVDDGSVDQTGAIIRQAAQDDQRILAVQADHRGVSAARNVGLRQACGEWVVFLDSDDTLPPDHLAAMVEAALLKPDAQLLHAGWRRFSPSGVLLGEYPAQQLADPFAATVRGCPFAIHAAAARREPLLALGGFDETLGMCEDWDLWQRLARTGARFAPLTDRWVEVHQRPGSVSSDGVRLLEHGLALIARGFSSDYRVTLPDPRHAAGAPEAEHAATRAYWLLWNWGNVIGKGGDLARLPELDADLALVGVVDLNDAAHTVVEGLLAGAGQPLSSWPDIWPRAERGVSQLCAMLDRVNPNSRDGGWLRYRVERHVSAKLSHLPELRVGGLQVATTEADHATRSMTLGAEVERFRCHLTSAGERVETLETLVYGQKPATVTINGAVIEVVPAAPVPEASLELPSTPYQMLRRRLTRLLRPMEPPASASFPPVATAHVTMAGLVARAEAPWLGRHVPPQSEPAEPWTAPDYASPNYWEGIFRSDDPWEYDNSYEGVKYQQTLALIEAPVERALEIACAEGHFTRMLAGRARTLVATDISPTALSRAAARCAELPGIEYQTLDLATDELPGAFDLIVCSEVLYYLRDRSALTAFGSKVAKALAPGGQLVIAHGNLLIDEPDRTGFPWPHSFGAKVIGETLAAVDGLELEREVWTPLYRIQTFRHTSPAELVEAEALPPAPQIQDPARRLPLRVAEQVRWRGAHEPAAADHWNNVPILMYHRIAQAGPEALSRYRLDPAMFAAQLELLRRAGWTGVSLPRLVAALHNDQPLPERSVVLSFDDSYVDFLDHALPALHRFGFPATLFVPVGKVGHTADWDARYGEPAPLLGWNDLALLRRCDVALGSHGRSHVALPALSADEQVDELAASRAELAHRVGGEVTAIAYPFGEYSPALADAARQCGYRVGMTCEYGWVNAQADPLVLPRVEIEGSLELEGFANLLGIKV